MRRGRDNDRRSESSRQQRNDGRREDDRDESDSSSDRTKRSSRQPLPDQQSHRDVGPSGAKRGANPAFSGYYKYKKEGHYVRECLEWDCDHPRCRQETSHVRGRHMVSHESVSMGIVMPDRVD